MTNSGPKSSVSTSPSTGTQRMKASGATKTSAPSTPFAPLAGIVAQAHASETNAAKSLAAQQLLSNAHWIYALWAAAASTSAAAPRQRIHGRKRRRNPPRGRASNSRRPNPRTSAPPSCSRNGASIVSSTNAANT